jgi:hypothetical protein
MIEEDVRMSAPVSLTPTLSTPLHTSPLLQAGAWYDTAFTEGFGFTPHPDSVYSIPAFCAQFGVIRCNVPPRCARLEASRMQHLCFLLRNIPGPLPCLPP